MDFKLKEILKDYKPPQDDELLFTDDDYETLLLKDIVYNLETYDRTIFLMYTELGSMKAVAKELGVSHTAVSKKMDQIKAHILDKFYEAKVRDLNNKIKHRLNGDNN